MDSNQPSQAVRRKLPSNFYPPAEVVASNVVMDPVDGPPEWARAHYERNRKLLQNPSFIEVITHAEMHAFQHLATMPATAPEMELRAALIRYQSVRAFVTNLVSQMEGFERGLAMVKSEQDALDREKK